MLRKTTLAVSLLVLGLLLAFRQPEKFDILIQRRRVVNNLVYGDISLNGKPLGAAFENNQLKIPAGAYKGVMRYSSKRGFVQSELGNMSNKGDFLLEVANVAGGSRTDILLHPGTLPRHSKGYILLGPATKGPDGAVTITDDHPLRKLRLAFYGTDEPISSPNKDITIVIKDF